MEFYAAVLAGGLSSRMGCDKRFLQFDGEFLVDRALRVCGQAIGNPGPDSRVLLCGNVPGRDCLVDQVPGLGPIGGLMAAFNYLKNRRCTKLAPSTWVLVVPTDMPLLSLEILNPLLDVVKAWSRPISPIVAYEGHEMPFLIHYNDLTKALIDARANEPVPSQRSIRKLQKQLNTFTIPLNEELRSVMANANSPLDWKSIHQQI